jgi:hypothetical protein
MPLIPSSEYRAPFLLGNAHFQTILPSAFRRVCGGSCQRERLETKDQDFLDLDWSCVGSPKLAILSHGLEGNSTRPYILGMVRALNRAGWDTLSWNFRGCSGEPNRLIRSYNSGDTRDLDWVVEHALAHARSYEAIALVGFSVGGNITLKYFGEKEATLNSRIKGAVAFSVPCDLASSANHLALVQNKIYMKRFLKLLREKLAAKAHLAAPELSLKGYANIKNFWDYDERYTAPLHGFQSAAHYYEKSSSKNFLAKISIPSLLISAKDDPFLTPQCFPFDEARANHHFFLETPDQGGHVGFMAFNRAHLYWSEKRAVQFLQAL